MIAAVEDWYNSGALSVSARPTSKESRIGW
jgi:hypothetical protein